MRWTTSPGGEWCTCCALGIGGVGWSSGAGTPPSDRALAAHRTENIELARISAIPVTRYRYRGSKIPLPGLLERPDGTDRGELGALRGARRVRRAVWGTDRQQRRHRASGRLNQELGFGVGMTRWRRLEEWNRAGVWRRLHEVLPAELHGAGKLDWSRAVIDSSHVRATRRGRKVVGATRRTLRRPRL
jgi:hypothetical protein